MISENINKKSVSNTTFAIVDIVFLKISTTVAFILLVRLLPSEAISAVGVGLGYLVFITYLDFGTIKVFFRDFPQYATDQKKYDIVLSAILASWIIQSLIMIIVGIMLTLFVFPTLELSGLTFLFYGLACEFIAFTFQEWTKVIFYANFRQATATKISILLSVCKLLSFMTLFIWPSLETYAIILIISAVATILIWAVVFKINYRFNLAWNRNTPKVMVNCLVDYGIWNHFNRTIIDTLLTIDVVLLCLMGYHMEIASYTIALKFVSLFAIVPMQLGRSLQVLIANHIDIEKQVKAINSFLKVNVLISIAQLVAVFLVGDIIVHILFGKNIDTQQVMKFALILVFGTTLLNICFPFLGILSNKSDLKLVFLTTFVPIVFVSIVVYVGSAFYYGGIGIAYGKIFIMGLLTALLIRKTFKSFKFKIRFKLLTDEEKIFLKSYLN